MTSTTLLSNAPDLRNSFPRSPNTLLGPYILLARILDKCRAVIAQTNGEYNFNCPLDRVFFDFTGIDAEAFQAEVAQGKSDEEMVAWVQSHSKPKTEEELCAWAYTTRFSRPTEPPMIAYFENTRRQVAPNKIYVETWFQLLDAEEGRL